MDVRFLPHPRGTALLGTREMREAFVCEDLFRPGEVRMVYCHADRAIIGGVAPLEAPLALTPSPKETAAEYFLERREAGIVNVGGEGIVRAGGAEWKLGLRDMVYLGRGTKDVEVGSVRGTDPALFYMVSFPAHASHPCTAAPLARAECASIGSGEGASRRTIRRYIHPGGVRSCQLVMGLTDLEPGSVWNTMPPHTHTRRMEVYLYFGLPPDGLVVHLMGEPGATRSLILRNRQAVISPPWSIHCGAGTASYSFVWAMGGENQEFADMDAVATAELF
ncbi:MAG: 5-dehydro-4-deoxy-D-glucuronate isomerase [Bacteroidota bacterium]